MWPRIHIMLLQVLDNTGDQSDVMSPLIELGSLLANKTAITITLNYLSLLCISILVDQTSVTEIRISKVRYTLTRLR